MQPTPPLKTDPKYGHYPWWPEDGDGWVHPEDVAAARSMIPGPRVFRRDGQQGAFVLLHYGALRLRVKPTLWQEVPAPAFEIGDWVEVLARGLLNTPRTGVVRDVHWDAASRSIQFFIEEAGTPIPNAYGIEDLRGVEPPAPREEVVIEPSEDAD